MELSRPTCATCPHWKDSHGGPDDGGGPRMGDCLRYPPVFLPTDALRGEGESINGEFWQGWQPSTSHHQGCGEHPDFPEYLKELRIRDVSTK